MILFSTIPASLLLYLDKIRTNSILGIYFVIHWNFLPKSNALLKKVQPKKEEKEKKCRTQSNLTIDEISYRRLFNINGKFFDHF